VTILALTLEHRTNAKGTLNQKGFKVDEEDMARVLPLSTKNILVHGQYSF